MKGRGYEGVVSVILTLFVTCAYTQNASSEERCVPVGTTSNDLSCTFQDGFCGWQNARDDDFDWEREKDTLSSNRHATAESYNSNSFARLESPWLCPTRGNFTSLKLLYYMGKDDSVCQFSVLIRTQSGTESVLETRSHHGSSYKDLGPVYIGCPNNRFQIILEAKKLRRGWCGTVLTTLGIDIDDIVVKIQDDTPSTFQVCLSPPTTEHLATPTSPLPPIPTTEDSSSSTGNPENAPPTTDDNASTSYPVVSGPVTSTAETGKHNGQKGNEDGGLDAGAVAGIVVAVLVVAAVIALVIFLLLLRQRREKSSKASQETNDMLREVTNRAYSPSDDLDAGSFSRHGTGHASTGSTEQSATYDNTPLPRSPDNISANPRQDADAYEAVASRQTGGACQTADGVRPNQSGNTVDGGSEGGKGKGDDQDEYNKLSFEPARVVGPSGANHLYDSTGVTDTYNALSHGNQETAVPKSTAADYDHVQK